MCLTSLCRVQAPRLEALTILGSLVCFPNTYREIPLWQPVPEVTEVTRGTEDVKVRDAMTESQVSIFYKFIYLFIYFLFLTVLGLRCCAWASSS